MSGSIDPTRAQFDAFKGLPRDKPVMMLNLLRLKAQASYEDGREATGREAYGAYSAASAPIFAGVGGEIIWRGRPETVVVGPEAEHWHLGFIARYPTAAAFLQMVTSPDYQAIVFHRQAAVEDSRLIRFGEVEGSAGFG
ncbi:MAG: DUF1330 domain-containing protein [Pseudomonadota bacterium]